MISIDAEGPMASIEVLFKDGDTHGVNYFDRVEVYETFIKVFAGRAITGFPMTSIRSFRIIDNHRYTEDGNIEEVIDPMVDLKKTQLERAKEGAVQLAMLRNKMVELKK